MTQALFSAKQAIFAQQLRVDNIANNVANINTTGFKSSRVDFKDTLYSQMTKPLGVNGVNLQNGTGVNVASTLRSFADGAPVQTESNLDFCLIGDGFFTLQDSEGKKIYTRSGSFAVSSEAGGRYLVNGNGYYVLNDQGSKLSLPEGDIEELNVSIGGEVTLGTNAAGSLKISSFANNQGLEAIGGACFAETAASGQAKDAEAVTVKQGFLESSNVDMAQEMTRLIRAQRALSLAGRALTTTDEMDGLANNMRR